MSSVEGEPERLQQELAMRRADREREFAGRIAVLQRIADQVEAEAAGSAFAALMRSALAAVRSVHEHGYAIVPGVLAEPELDELRGMLGPVFDDIRQRFAALPADAPRQTFHVHNLLGKTRAADAAALNPLLRTCITGILGPDFLLHAGAVAMAPDPGCAPQGLHRDDASFSALPRPRMPLVVTAAFALDDFTPDNGATRLVPGSCWWERDRRPVADEVIPCTMNAGSLLLWDGAIFHGGGANVTAAATRRTLSFNYTRGWLRTQFNQFLSIPRDVVLALPPELQHDLGYAPSAKGLGEVDDMHPLEYLRRLQAAGGDGAQARLNPDAAEERA